MLLLGRGRCCRYRGLYLQEYGAVLVPPPSGPLERSGNGVWLKPSSAWRLVHPVGKLGTTSYPKGPASGAPRKERQVDLSQNGYAKHLPLSLSLSRSLQSSPHSQQAVPRVSALAFGPLAWQIEDSPSLSRFHSQGLSLALKEKCPSKDHRPRKTSVSEA